MVIFWFLFILWGVFCWRKGEQSKSLIVFLFLATAGFNLKILSSTFSGIFTGPNLTLLFVTIILFIDFFEKKNVFSVSNDKIALVVWLLIIYSFTSFIVTIFFDIELPNEAFKTFRESIFPFYYFIFRQIKWQEYEKFFKIAFKISVCWAVVFFLQPLGFHLLGGITSDSGIGMSRYYNYPDLSLIFFLWSITIKTSVLKRTFLILCFGIPMLMMQGRNLMLVFLILPMYFYFIGYAKKMFSLFFISLVIFLLLAPYITARFNINEMINEVSSSSSIDANSTNDEVDNNFAFRTAIVMERLEYMADNDFIFTGIGSMNEDSPITQKRFNFKFCSVRVFKGALWRQQIVCGDVAFLNQFIKYGLIYIVIFILFYVLMYKKLRSYNTQIGDIGAAFILVMFLVALSGNWFNIINTSIIFVLLSYEKNRPCVQPF